MLEFESPRAQRLRFAKGSGQKLKFRHFQMADSNTGQRFRIRGVTNQIQHDRPSKLPPRRKRSPFRFEGERTGDSKLRFDNQSSWAQKIGNIGQLQNEHTGRFASQFSAEASQQLSNLADSSDNDSVRAADAERRTVRQGYRLGKAYGKHYRNTADQRLSKRQGKELKRELMAQRHMEQFGEPTQKGYRQQISKQKKLLRRKQVRQFCEKAVGNKATEALAQAMRWIVAATKKAVTWAITSFGFPVLGAVLFIIILFLGAAMLFSLFSTTVITSVSSYTAEDAAIEQATMLATKLEAELEQEIAGIPSQWIWGHIDEFRYNVDPIGHDPWQLMAYLSVVHPGFDMDMFSPVPATIRTLHDTRYQLLLEEESEIRYRTETSTDPVTGEETEEEVAYTYYILNVRLSSRSIEAAVYETLQASPEGEQWEWYQLLQETGGARQEFTNPFDIDWRGRYSSKYGYRIDPVGGRNLQIHRGLDIPMPQGTPIRAGLTGTVRYAGVDAKFGNYIVLENEEGVTMQYAHCYQLELRTGDMVTAGQVIAQVGSTGNSTGNHVHIEIKKDGNYINPIYAISYETEEE